MRLIDADALMEFARNHVNHTVDCNDIARFPQIDAEPVRHGRWIEGGYACGENEWECSGCHETEWRTSISRFKYCPFCGARMDADTET